MASSMRPLSTVAAKIVTNVQKIQFSFTDIYLLHKFSCHQLVLILHYRQTGKNSMQDIIALNNS
jgi:hypothetical protein